MNERIKKIVGGKHLVMLFGESGNITVMLQQESPSYIVDGAQNLCVKIFISMSVHVFITGSLAFYSTVLGKENTSGNWCSWCRHSNKQWAKP